MRFYSTRQKAPSVSFKEALFKGQASDGGLYLPESYPKIYEKLDIFFAETYPDFATLVLKNFLNEEIHLAELKAITQLAYNFEPQLIKLDKNFYILELFHGPTFSFKDFGARFMANAMHYFEKNNGKKINILVATSGDTGSAVAQAFHDIDQIKVILLYPSGKVSELQEKQLTTIGDNVLALEVEGTFDDCQALVKRAFADNDLQNVNLTSANSINIGRLLPQSIYYAWAAAQLNQNSLSEIIFSVPSGNFGNLCGGLIANMMGLSVNKFIAAVNSNSVIPDCLETGQYVPRSSIKTLSNAMDVGNPSNWERVSALYKNDIENIKEIVWSTSVNDSETLSTIREIYLKYNYLIDPHTAVGIKAVEKYKSISKDNDRPVIVLSTAHPAKFADIVSSTINKEIELPDALQKIIKKEKLARKLPPDYLEFKKVLVA